jgi:hypothetical protein
VRTISPGNPHTDLFVRVQTTFRHRQAEFLKTELATCLRSTNLALQMYKAGDTVSAGRTSAAAEQCYSDVLRLMSDPKDSKRLTIKANQEFMAKLKDLRKMLDGLQRFRIKNTEY